MVRTGEAKRFMQLWVVICSLMKPVTSMLITKFNADKIMVELEDKEWVL